ncbi:histidine phosphatase superfamily [Phakopsora pachyrhizi]|nr:histidine phosphatase superfamily [Phakopsora pachyrhizi]
MNLYHLINYFVLFLNKKIKNKKYGSNSSFGLIDSSSNDRWKNFQSEIDQIIRNQPTNVAHIVLFIARHGQGYHNVAESKYGTPLWDCYWSEINGDGNLTWGPDARLTELGQEQARVAGLAWSREIEDGLPIPQLFISSPLSRALYTMELTGAYKHSNQTPIVKEHWRENIGLHTCDKRRTKSIILGDFRFVRFEDGFSEDDDFWTPDLQETDLQLDVRIRGALGDLFLVSTESNITYISITAHSGVISSLLRVIGHRPFPIQTGGMIPLVIKATTTATRTRPPSPGPSATKPNCPNY